MSTDTEDRPNLLLIVTDQQRWDTVGAHGSPVDVTPTVDRLATTGARFDQAVTPQPTCGSAQSAIQTGRHATETGVWRHSLPLSDDVTTLAEYVDDYGYEAGYVGKWDLAGTFEDPVPPSFRGGYDDFWIAADVPEFTSQPYGGQLFDGFGEPVSFDKYRADAFTDFAIRALDSLSAPFVLTVTFLEPHHQNDRQTFVAPDGYADRFADDPYVPGDLQDRPGDWFRELPDYYGMVQRIDECVGRLVTALEDRGLREETVIAFTSDHGCHFRTRPGEYKRSCHEGSIRVPAVLNGPGVEAGTVVEDVVSLVDLAPTLLTLLGIDVPAELRDRGWLSDSADRPSEGGDAFVQTSGAEIGRTIRTDRWKLSVAAPTLDGWRGGKADKASDLYVERYLYDLARDPHERVNLAGRPEHRGVFDDLRSRLLEYIHEVEGADPDIVELSDPGYQDY
jgi:arylsulfatase A-like enzyme